MAKKNFTMEEVKILENDAYNRGYERGWQDRDKECLKFIDLLKLRLSMKVAHKDFPQTAYYVAKDVIDELMDEELSEVQD